MKATSVFGILTFIAIIGAAALYIVESLKLTDGDTSSINGSMQHLSHYTDCIKIASKLGTVILHDDFNSENQEVWYKSPYGGPHGTQFLPELVYIPPGESQLVLLSDVNKHIGSQYESKSLYHYGKYKARIKTCNTPGSTMAFFMYKGPEPDGHNELDIEFEKKDGRTKIYFSTYYHRQQNSYVYDPPFDPGAAFHDYAFYWYPDRVEFYVDDMTTPVWTSYQYVPNEPCYLIFNNWILSHPIDTSGFETTTNAMYVDWVRVESL